MDILGPGRAFFASFGLEVVRLSVWLLLLTAIFVPLERAFAAHRQKVLRKDVFADVAYYFLNGLMINFLLVVPIALLAACLHRIVPGALLSATAGLPLWARIPAVLIVGEIGFYWGHRWSHEIPLLWRFHAVHHSPRQIDWLVNTRAHPVDMFFTRLCGFTLLYVLGLSQATAASPDAAPVLLVLVGTMWGFFIHANVSWRFGWLEWLVSTPAFHHWHHTNDQHRDNNYAALLPALDWLFGTFHLPRHALPPQYGIDTAIPTGLGSQIMRPLLPSRS
jgi:sterol desaturase/sphingolipid hydroxylase (fatty acid hydroxylase superfamily)